MSSALQFTIEGQITQANTGDSWNLTANVLHGAEALEDSTLVEVFSPPREDYLKYYPNET